MNTTSRAAILALITAFAMLGAPWLVWLFAPGFGRDPDKLAMTADMLTKLRHRHIAGKLSH